MDRENAYGVGFGIIGWIAGALLASGITGLASTGCNNFAAPIVFGGTMTLFGLVAILVNCIL